MEWKKGSYTISGKWNGAYMKINATGYVCKICDGLEVGITNKIPVDNGIKWKPAGFWTMSILPEGLVFKTFKRKKDAMKFIEKQCDYLEKYVRDTRRLKYGSVNAAHEE